MELHISLIFCLLCALDCGWASLTKTCARDQSRVVSRLVREKILPAFHRHNAPLAPTCQFAIERDQFFLHEESKVMETGSRWTCDFCGKAFISEFWLDTHFENRHLEHVQKDDALCLADVCDVFRCDIVSGAATPDYWDIALCMEEDMQDLYNQCEKLVDECIPPGLTKNQSSSIKGQVMDNICSFLTCTKFWNSPAQQEDSQHLALYIVLSVMISFGILIYNLIFYNYFYSDLAYNNYDRPRRKHTFPPYHKHQSQARRRYEMNLN